MKTPILKIESLSLAYSKQEKHLFQDVNLQANKGEVIVLLGENGIGKSSLLKSIAGQLKFNAGKIEIKAKAIADWNKKALAETMAWVDTQLSFSEYISVGEFVAFGRYPFTNWLGRLKVKDIEVVQEVLKACNLDHLKDFSIAKLSDGEKQKVFIARALAQETELLILDEPTTHLDTKNTAVVFSLLKKQSISSSKTVIFSSHKFENALQIADKIWLFDGKSILSTTPEEFLQSTDLQQILLGDSVEYDKEKQGFRYTI